MKVVVIIRLFNYQKRMFLHFFISNLSGENYRFGYKAAGDAVELVKLCEEYNLKAFIVSSVMDKAQKCHNGSSRGVLGPNDKGQVSSSRVRQALFKGDMTYVSELLGRKHRLIMAVNDMCQVLNTEVSIPKSCLLNLPPTEGTYENCALFVNEVLIGSCQVVIDTEIVQIKMEGGSPVRNIMHDCQVLGVEFG